MRSQAVLKARLESYTAGLLLHLSDPDQVSDSNSVFSIDVGSLTVAEGEWKGNLSYWTTPISKNLRCVRCGHPV